MPHTQPSPSLLLMLPSPFSPRGVRSWELKGQTQSTTHLLYKWGNLVQDGGKHLPKGRENQIQWSVEAQMALWGLLSGRGGRRGGSLAQGRQSLAAALQEVGGGGKWGNSLEEEGSTCASQLGCLTPLSNSAFSASHPHSCLPMLTSILPFGETLGWEPGTWSQHSGNWAKPLPLQASVKRGTVAPTSPSRCKDK